MNQVVRVIAFVAGAFAAVASAIVIALEAGVQVRPVHWFALGGTALAAYATKWVGDYTKAEVREFEARVRRESMLPTYPPGDQPLEFPPEPGIGALEEPVRRMEAAEPAEPPSPYLARRDRRTGRP